MIKYFKNWASIWSYVIELANDNSSDYFKFWANTIMTKADVILNTTLLIAEKIGLLWILCTFNVIPI